jgi:hypothetical protein
MKQVAKCLFTVEHLCKHLRRDSCKIFVSFSPKWLCGVCCFDLAHCTNFRSDGYGKRILNELYMVRRCMKKTLFNRKIRNVRVLDTLGSLTGKNTAEELLASMRVITAKDIVHLIDSGYAALAHGLVREVLSSQSRRAKAASCVTRA